MAEVYSSKVKLLKFAHQLRAEKFAVYVAHHFGKSLVMRSNFVAVYPRGLQIAGVLLYRPRIREVLQRAATLNKLTSIACGNRNQPQYG